MNIADKILKIILQLNAIVAVVSLVVFVATMNAAWLIGTCSGVATVALWWYYHRNKNAEPTPDGVKDTPPASVVPSDGVQIQNNIHKLSRHVRTPLSNIVGIANVLSGDFNPENKKPLVDSLVASVETITDLFDMINGESDGKPFGIDVNDAVRVFDLRNLITQTAELTPGVEAKLEVYGELPLLKGNSVKMRRIMLSIFDFFLHYTPKDLLPAQVTIVINRVRIPIKPIKYRFDVKSSFAINVKPDAQITELNIAKRLIEELGGNTKHRFEDDSTFIYFNVCFDGEEDNKPAAATSASSKKIEVFTNETVGFTNVARAKTLEEANIIVCDDNPINQKVMSLSLDKHVKVITLASNGQECVDLVANGRYDLILMDIQMPVMDGYEATMAIRKLDSEYCRRVPIIAMTANVFAEDKVKAMNVGMNGHIAKPIDTHEMFTTLKSILDC